MAAPILGAVAGLLVVSRLGAVKQNRSVLWMSLTMPLPLLITVVEPPLPVVWVAWFACGALQAFMLPLQSTFTLLVPAALRGRVFGLAGAISVAATGAFYLLAGWISQNTRPAAAGGSVRHRQPRRDGARRRPVAPGRARRGGGAHLQPAGGHEPGVRDHPGRRDRRRLPQGETATGGHRGAA